MRYETHHHDAYVGRLCGFGFGLATMNPDGSARHFILLNPEEMHQPDWESVP